MLLPTSCRQRAGIDKYLFSEIAKFAGCVCRSNISESLAEESVMKSLQAAKINEVAEALVRTGYVHLPEQASALGLPRSTTWTIVQAKHKNYGLSAAVIKQMLAQPQLPRLVRAKICEYVNEKCAGMYGDNPERLRRFSAALSSDQRTMI